MYDLTTMIRLPVHDKSGTVIGDHVALAQVEIAEPR
jgi:hypothetical protein